MLKFFFISLGIVWGIFYSSMVGIGVQTNFGTVWFWSLIAACTVYYFSFFWLKKSQIIKI
jgi:hypothetical protein